MFQNKHGKIQCCLLRKLFFPSEPGHKDTWIPQNTDLEEVWVLQESAIWRQE